MPEQQSAARAGELRLTPLVPPSEPATVPAIVEELGLLERSERDGSRPHVLLNMIATVDGRATLGGRSGPLSGPADRELFHGLRAGVDAVLVGAGTARAERYGRMIPAEANRRLRRKRGLDEEPLACIVSGRLALDADLPLLATPSARVAVVTASAASLPPTAADVDYVRSGQEGVLDLSGALSELRSRFGVGSVLCEGGPHLARQLFGDALIDELFLSVSPRLGGGEPAAGEALRILAGAELDPAVELELLGVLRRDSYLFLRYGVSA
jgi:riboflavin biosynthesis pyrimidine reductase